MVPFFSGKSAFGIHEETRDGINSGGPSLEIYERPVLEHSKETARKLGMDFDLFFSSSPEFRRGKFLRSREREREIAFHVSFSLAALRERAKPFIPGSLLKSRVSGTVSMVHDTSRKLNRSRGRVITSRLLERKKKKAAVCREGRNKGREKEGGMLAKDLRSLILPILCPNDLKTRAYASGSR